jgi:hypothetical protein
LTCIKCKEFMCDSCKTCDDNATRYASSTSSALRNDRMNNIYWIGLKREGI